MGYSNKSGVVSLCKQKGNDMSKAGLKKAFRSMTRDEIAEMVLELYDARREAKDYLDYWLAPDPDRALDEAKASAEKMFFYSTGKPRSQPAAADLKRLVKNFSTLVFDSDKIADLLMYIAERQYIWVTQKRSGFLQAEVAVRRAYDNARVYIEGAALEDLYGLRLERLAESIDDFFRDPPRPQRRSRRWHW
jgi:hypothetical protein